LAGAYAVVAIPVRYALERRDWPAAAAMSEPAIGFPHEHFPWAEAMIVYARALGDARTGNMTGAEAEIGRLQSLEVKLKGNDTYSSTSHSGLLQSAASAGFHPQREAFCRVAAARPRPQRPIGQALRP
jgi:hypothetical protein